MQIHDNHQQLTRPAAVEIKTYMAAVRERRPCIWIFEKCDENLDRLATARAKPITEFDLKNMPEGDWLVLLSVYSSEVHRLLPAEIAEHVTLSNDGIESIFSIIYCMQSWQNVTDFLNRNASFYDELSTDSVAYVMLSTMTDRSGWQQDQDSKAKQIELAMQVFDDVH